MADKEKLEDVQLLKRTRISVFVDEALPDLLVVTYEFGVKIFKGVLLDSTKRNLPCGVPTLNPAFSVPTPKSNADDDVLYSVNQRYAYTDPQYAKPKNVRMPSKYKNNKMTVRLRPRQVLCSKCKGICNENSENVSRKRKSTDSTPPPPPVKRGANAPITRSVYSEQLNKRKAELRLQPTLIPKVSRLLPQDIDNAINGNPSKIIKEDNDTSKKHNILVSNENANIEQTEESTDHSIQHSDSANILQVQNESEVPFGGSQDMEIHTKSVRRILRKKRSIGSMEDLWDESVFEEGVNSKNNIGNALAEQTHNVGNACLSTRTIKISYGPQGEGTVLKIPAQIDNLNVSDDSEENINIEEQPKNKEIDNKAARKALKRAKKKARHKILFSGNSPSYLSGTSPRYSIGNSSPRYIIGSGSPRHILGNNSPRYVTSANDLHVPKRHKHKMKRKKRHREDKDRKHKENEVSSASDNTTKEQNVSQKLSINLKRLNNTYSCQSASDKGEDNTSSSDEHSEQVPDFPPSNPPLMMRVNAQTVSSAIGADGGRLLVGDVVWGKIHGFPWWPGKVLTITNSGSQGPQAHVSWYGSSTSSLIQCDQLSPYLENFKIRYNKKKRGPYKEAIRQATSEAKENAETKIRRETTPIVSSPAHSIMTVPPPALASPREIDVMS